MVTSGRQNSTVGLSLEPDIAFGTDAWSRHRARFLEPASAVQLPGEQPRIQPTAYVANALLVRTGDSDKVLDTLSAVAKKSGYYARRDPHGVGDRSWLDGLALTDEQRHEIAHRWVERIRLVPDRESQELVRADDAWRVLQSYRLAVGKDDDHLAVALEHLVATTTPSIGGAPVTSSHGIGGNPVTSSHGIGGSPVTSSHGISGYGVPGSGGRQPVNWVGPPPYPRFEDHGVRCPVVAVLDTGIGAHPWHDDGHVLRDLQVEGVPLDVAASAPDSEDAGSTDPLVGTLDPDAGHGTFIAGLIRQQCPDATVLAVRLFHGDGVVGEWDLLRALQLLTVRHALAVNGDDRYQSVDVVSMSFGYYHEQPSDTAYSALLGDWLQLLGSYGVAVVASAGNDATVRPMYPAALAPCAEDAVDTDRVPLVGVGALNPDGTVALFSNAGPWVGYHRPGASLVSSYPPSVDASGSPTIELEHEGTRRASIDPDDYSAGFAVWSGTSFAAPIFAGELAARLLDEHLCGDDSTDPAAAIARTRKVLASMPKVR